jgi:peptidoglycan hydrolase-like protein with peptidoglycan-binding domain
VHRNRAVTSLFATLTLAATGGALLAPAADAAPSKRPRLGARTLQQGASGDDVRRLQQLLRATGFALDVDGEFGPGTAHVVQSFQSVTGLKITGVVDRPTVAYLIAATDDSGTAAAADNGGFSQSTIPDRHDSLGDRLPVKQGMSGRDVAMLQRFLRRAAVADIAADGEFGRATVGAVRIWEHHAGRRADGQMDGGDVATLREQVGRVRGAPPASTSSTTTTSTPTPAPAAPPAVTNSGSRARIAAGGLAVAPADAPDAVKEIIAAGNQIASKPYIFGGGHRADWKMDAGYDCSGSVSWALHGAGLVTSPAPSSGYFGWGLAGPGRWVTIYTQPSHMYMVVAGLRFDTSGRSAAGTRWHTDMRSSAGYVSRHPSGL